MKFTAGFIGCGNMGGALARCAAKALGGEKIAVCDNYPALTEAIRQEFGVYCADISGISSLCKYIFLGVKPQVMGNALDSIKPELISRNDFILVTMAAGLDIAYFRSYLGFDCPIIRIMPNTPCAVGEGMILCTASDNVSEETLDEFRSMMSAAGRIDMIAEKLIDAGSAVSGCGPAFAYIFAEALADAGVECGLPRKSAYEYAAQMMLGSAKMILELGSAPAVLKDSVCSPGGTTIAGVHALENDGFRASVMDAVVSAYEKTLKLKK